MKYICVVLALISTVAFTSGYTVIKQNAYDPKAPSKCYDKDTKQYYNVGNNYNTAKCERIHCSLNDYELLYIG